MNITGYMGTKSTQIFAYADDVAIMSRNKNGLKDTLVNTEREAKKKKGVFKLTKIRQSIWK